MRYIISGNNLTVLHEGVIYTYEGEITEEIKNALHNEDVENLIWHISPDLKLKQSLRNYPELSYKDGVLTYYGEEVPSILNTRIIKMLEQDLPLEALLNFVSNLFENPSHNSVQQLYRFLDANNLPITEDGCFVAYKTVRENYYDLHSNKNRNMVGDVVSMPRNKVVDDPNQCCSSGLHAASIEYLRNYRGAKLMAIKINPADVVSVPVTYENTKLRCCRYEVVEELDAKLMGTQEDILGEQVVYKYSTSLS